MSDGIEIHNSALKYNKNPDYACRIHVDRGFFINKHYGGCNTDNGWMLILDATNTNTGCGWDKQPASPLFLYSPFENSMTWSDGSGNKNGKHLQ